MGQMDNSNVTDLGVTHCAAPATHLFLCISLISCSLLAGCHTPGEPQIRVGHYPTATWGMRFVGPNDLGPHSYTRHAREGNGIAYTRLAGHIDITHVRSTADWTKYLAEMTFQHLLQGQSYFTFKSNTEPSIYHVHLTYPPNWDRSPEREQELRCWSLAVEIAAYTVFQAATWHEILTWFGHRFLSPFPEFPSAFSWEDTYSNALGVYLAGQVLRTDSSRYNERFTSALRSELTKLDIQSKSQAREASNSVRGLWYRGQLAGFVKIRCRNIDIGLGDGLVSPVLIPMATSQPGDSGPAYPIPRLQSLEEQGLSMRLEIEPREWIKGRILRIVSAEDQARVDRILPALHFPQLMDHIRHSALAQGMIVYD